MPLRRLIAGLLLSFAALAGTVALTAHVLDVVAFDPGRPGRVLAAMVETDEGQTLAADAISAQLQATVPQLDDRRADRLAARVAGDPKLAQTLRGDGVDPWSAVRAVVGKYDPRLRPRLRSAETDPHAARAAGEVGDSPFGFASTTDLLAGADNGVRGDVGRAHETVASAARAGTLVALLLVAGALALGPRRDLLVRRVGRWLLTASVAGVVLWLLVPRVLLPRLGGRWPVVVAAGIEEAGTGLTVLFGTLLVCGVVAVVGGRAGAFLVPQLARRDVPESVRRDAQRQAREREARESCR